MDIVEFAEKIVNFPLKDYQKEFLRKAYECIKTNRTLFYLPPRCNSRFSYEILLQAIAIIAVSSERNQLKCKAEIMDKTEKT